MQVPNHIQSSTYAAQNRDLQISESLELPESLIFNPRNQHQLSPKNCKISERVFKRIRPLLVNIEENSVVLVCDLVQTLLNKLKDMSEEKDNKIQKLQQALNYFYQKFVKAKQKLNLLSKNLFKIKNFEKNESLNTILNEAGEIEDLYFLKTPPFTTTREEVSSKIKPLNFGGKIKTKQKKSSDNITKDGFSKLHQTLELRKQMELQDFNSLDSSKRLLQETFHRSLGKSYDMPVLEKRRSSKKEMGIDLKEYLNFGNQDLSSCKLQRNLTNKNLLSKQTYEESGKLANLIKRQRLFSDQSHKMGTRDVLPMEDLKDSHFNTKSQYKGELQKRRNSKPFVRNSKNSNKVKRTKKKKTSDVLTKFNNPVKNHVAKENQIKRNNKNGTTDAVPSSSSKMNKKKSLRYISRQKGNTRREVGNNSQQENIHKMVSGMVSRSKGQHRRSSGKTLQSMKYSSSHQQIKNAKMSVKKNHAANYNKASTNKKMKTSLNSKVLFTKNKNKLISSHKKKRSRGEAKMGSILNKQLLQEHIPAVQNLFMNHNTPSLKNFSNGLNHLKLNFILSQSKIDKRKKYDIKMLYSKPTPKNANDILKVLGESDDANKIKRKKRRFYRLKDNNFSSKKQL